MKSPFQTWLVRLAILAVVPFFLSSCGSSYSTPTTTTYTIGGMVSGLSGTGLVLQDNGGNSLSVTTNGNFTFTTAVASGGGYAVTVSTQPTGQNCTVTNGSGTASANVTNVQVACANATFTIGLTVSGLTGTGLVLQDNGGDNLSITGNTTFTFATAVSGAYAVTVFSYPTGPVQNCVVTNGSGTASANVTNVQVACTNGFTIGGTVVNLASTGLVLQDNGGNNLSVTANGNFTFTEPVDAASPYAVTVSTQPSNPAQTCDVTSGSGTANATVTNVMVDCSHNEWAWINGLNANPSGTGNPGMYPATTGTAATTNLPGSRNYGAVSWTDASGNLWLFGGNGNDSTPTTVGDLNDLWKYNIASGEWTWVGGSNMANQNPNYGGTTPPVTGGSPGARDSSVGWIDASGNLWLFGGEGYDSTGTFGYLNDLWEYSVTNNQWTWVGGSNLVNQPGNYGTVKVAATTNVPGSRGFSTVQNINGVVWLFGGFGNDSTPLPGQQDNLNDLWQFSGGEWTWMGGSNTVDQVGNYGTLGTPSGPPTPTVPGSRYSPASWTDKSGNLWLFGGEHLEPDGVTVDYFNDLWEYSTSTNEWTWKGGPNVIDTKGTYGIEGTAASTNIPGARGDMSSWTDPSGNFWLFGGFGLDSAGVLPGGDLNDMWEYSVSTNEWTWKNGSNIANQNGVYGTLGQLAPLNIPGNREGGSSWTDSSGNLWLFGGSGTNAINDLWKYFP